MTLQTYTTHNLANYSDNYKVTPETTNKPKLLEQSSIKTTMIYTHLINQVAGVISPLSVMKNNNFRNFYLSLTKRSTFT